MYMSQLFVYTLLFLCILRVLFFCLRTSFLASAICIKTGHRPLSRALFELHDCSIVGSIIFCLIVSCACTVTDVSRFLL